MLFVLCTSSAVPPPYDILSISFTSVASLPLPSVHLIAAGTWSCSVNTRPRGVEDGIIKPRTVLASKTNILIGRIMRTCELPVTQEEVREDAPELAGGVYEYESREVLYMWPPACPVHMQSEVAQSEVWRSDVAVESRAASYVQLSLHPV